MATNQTMHCSNGNPFNLHIETLTGSWRLPRTIPINIALSLSQISLPESLWFGDFAVHLSIFVSTQDDNIQKRSQRSGLYPTVKSIAPQRMPWSSGRRKESAPIIAIGWGYYCPGAETWSYNVKPGSILRWAQGLAYLLFECGLNVNCRRATCVAVGVMWLRREGWIFWVLLWWLLLMEWIDAAVGLFWWHNECFGAYVWNRLKQHNLG